MSGSSWPDEFFFQWPPPDWINTSREDRQDFRPFLPSEGKWMLGRPVGTCLRSNKAQNQALWLLIQHNETYIRKYVAKVFPEYPERHAQSQLRRFRPRVPKTIQEVKDELDPYLNEARAYHRIKMSCPSSQRIYFPEFQGVIPDLGLSKFTYGFDNPRAIVLEPIRPKLTSRRILSAHCRENNCEFQDQLKKLGSLSDLEVEYYHGLFHDRIRRVLALHTLGIAHGDLRDDHFRLPEDFYDTVLYDFSHSYTFSPVTPYLVNFRPPRPLKDISDTEQALVKQQVLDRAKELDFRNHLINSTEVAQSTIIDALFQPLKDESLELIILRIKFRPDAFSTPSVTSVFPFLEAICSEDDHTWHIRRARLLVCYRSIWISSVTDSSGETTLSFVSDQGCTQSLEGSRTRYILCLVPKNWGVYDIRSPLLRICSSLPSGKHGCIRARLESENQA